MRACFSVFLNQNDRYELTEEVCQRNKLNLLYAALYVLSLRRFSSVFYRQKWLFLAISSAWFEITGLIHTNPRPVFICNFEQIGQIWGWFGTKRSWQFLLGCYQMSLWATLIQSDNWQCSVEKGEERFVPNQLYIWPICAKLQMNTGLGFVWINPVISNQPEEMARHDHFCR